MGEDASSDDAVDLPVVPVEEAGPTVATVAAETAIDYSTKRPKMTPVTDFAAAINYVAIFPFVVLPEAHWISLHLKTRQTMDSIADE